MKSQIVNKVAVIGAGLMGCGAGVDFARWGYQVALYNTNKESSKQAMINAREILDLMTEFELVTKEAAKEAFARLIPTTDIEEATNGAGFVLESVLEKLDLKKQIFAQLDEICAPLVILATNTSGFRVTEIASVTRHPERVIATHYFQPPHLIPLVEVVPGEKTGLEVIAKTHLILTQMRKKAVVIRKELPGFVGNRIQLALEQEIQSLVDQGVATPEMIDDIITFGFGRRMGYTGYFKRNDLIGLDFRYIRAKEMGKEPWKPVKEHVERGELGMKTGKGFYDWPGDTAKIFLKNYNSELIRLLKQDMEAGKL